MTGTVHSKLTSRDAFPVFDDPPMVSAEEAQARRLVYDRDAVIGVAHGG